MISPNMRSLLDTCVRLMAAGSENQELDFFPLRGELRKFQPGCIAYLAEQLEHITNGQLSVRQTRYDVIVGAPMGISNLFLAVCSPQTPQGMVTSPTEDMTPYIIAPGHGIGCTKAEWMTPSS